MDITLKNSVITMSYISTRHFELYTDSGNILIKRNSDYKIEKVIIDEEFSIKIGQTIKVDGWEYTIKEIKEHNSGFRAIQEYITKTAQFIFPILEGNYEEYDFNDSFHNAYISDTYDSLYLVYKFINSAKYLELEANFEKHPNFIELVDLDSNFIYVRFNIHKKWYPDIKLIMKGKYSSISSNLKSKICLFHGFGSNTKTYRVLYRDKTIRKEKELELNCSIPTELDVISKPIKNQEIWTSQNILKKDGIQNLKTM